MILVLLKLVHVAAIALWSAGLLVLPFLYLQRRHLEGNALYRLHAFTRMIYVFMASPAAFVAIGTGAGLIFLRQTFEPWFSVKLAFVGLMVGIHVLNGLKILRLFEPGKTYPSPRFALVSTATTAVITCILVIVLGKPQLQMLDPFGDLFVPGELQVRLGFLTAWWK